MHNSKRKTILVVILASSIIAGVALLIKNSSSTPETPAVISDYKNISYIIDGHSVELKDGVAETEAAPGSASKIITRYFGNELRTDLNNDGREDIVFLLTQQAGGTGTFYFVIAALATTTGYRGSEGYFIGDRIAPQAIELSHNPQQKNVVVIQYADRKPGEPMTAQPSVGKSIYLKFDPATMRWGSVDHM